MKALSYLIPCLTMLVAQASVAQQRGGSDPANPDRLVFTEKALPKDVKHSEGVSEIDDFARRRGLNYARVTRSAARGDAKALKQFFAMAKEVDGAAAESYSGMPTTVYHLLGDEKFAKFLNTQPLAFRVMVRNAILSDGLPAPAKIYLPRHFPETSKTLFRREIVDWPSPDKRYAIRKVFSDELDLRGSKVERADVIDAKRERRVRLVERVGPGGCLRRERCDRLRPPFADHGHGQCEQRGGRDPGDPTGIRPWCAHLDLHDLGIPIQLPTAI